MGFVKERGITYDEVVGLGDYVDYGTRPNEVVEWFRENSGMNLLGNHDVALFEGGHRDYFSDLALRCSLWTESVIKEENLEFLKTLPPIIRGRNITYTHASPTDPLWDYVVGVVEAERAFRADGADVIFVGHTHIPSYFFWHRGQVGGSRVVAQQMTVKLTPGIRYIINPGSVGQPRDGLGGASFGVFDSEEMTFTWYRVDYDISPLRDEVKRAGLPLSLLSYFL